MAAPVGAVVGLYYDSPRQVDIDDVIQTPSGRSYRVVHVRVQEKGKHAGRKHIRGLVIDKADISPDDTVLPLHWYSRG